MPHFSGFEAMNAAVIEPKPIRIIVGFSPSSASNRLAELLAPGLAAALGAPVEVVRHPGANGAAAAALVASGTADGHTLFMATLGTHVVQPALGGVPYDPPADFAPVSLVSVAPMIIAARRQLGADTVQDLIALGEAAEPPLTFGCSASWGAPHLAGSVFGLRAGIRLRPAIYDDTAMLCSDLAAGKIDLTFNNIPPLLPLMPDRVRGIAVTGRVRAASLPNVPTVAESGLADYEIRNWLGLVAPRRTPGATVAALSGGVQTAIASLKSQSGAPAGVDLESSEPSHFVDFLRAERARWADVLRQLA